VTLSLILQFNIRLGGYSIWSAIFQSHTIQRSNLGHEHLIASMQPRKYSKKNFKTELQKKPKTTSKYSRSLQYSATKSSGACQTRGHGTVYIT
jgi:hypothetical protein